jgi:NADPH:quinone reductase-like Zn-dependent oxidoreductase/ubiquinone/menaquinone biosynthesis C-methylase UbiE
LVNIAKQIPGGNTVEYNSVLRRFYSAAESALEAAGSLFCHGFAVDLLEVNSIGASSAPKPLMLTDLPSYRFNHSKEYWAESKLSRDFRFRPHNRHELLGVPVPDWNKDNAIWRNHIRISENPWIEDHKVSGDILYPAAGMLVMAIEASRQISDNNKVLKGFRFRDVSFHLALRVPDDAQGIESHFYLRPCREANLPVTTPWHEFQLATFEDSEWREHCRGLVQTEYQLEQKPVDGSLEDQMIRSRCDQELKNAEGVCAAKIPVEKLYTNFQESGLDFGPTFQTLSDVWLGPESRVFARLDSSVHKIKKLMPYEYIQPHLIHPAVLDGVVHANLAPLVLESKELQQSRVPIYANEIWVSANPQIPHDSYRVTAQPRLRGRNETESSVTAVQTETGQPMVYASGLVFKTVPGNASQETSNPARQSAFNVDWKPDPTLLSEQQALQAFGLPMAPEDDPSEWMRDCEALCFLYISQYLDTLSKESIEKMDWHHKKYVSWMEHVRGNSKPEITCNDIKELEGKVKARGVAEGKLIIAVGQALHEMLEGPRDPLDVIFGNKIAEEVYRDGLGSNRCYVQLCNYIDALAHKNPAMEILEIGAGTGGATRPVMKTLTEHGRRYQHYDFTDISPSFFEQAREVFKDEVGNMGFHVLNVEKDTLEQGFTESKYDLIVAANVLHATKNIETSLSNARRLLKPGGKLVLFEITNTSILLGSFCFGVLPGWWLSEDVDRIWGPLMSPENWRSHLFNSGFAGLDAVFHDFPNSTHQMSSILVSTVPTVNSPPLTTSSTYILIDESSSLQKDAAKEISIALAEQGPGEVISITGLGEKDITNSTCIALAELEASVLEDMTEQTFDSVKRIVNQSKTLIWLTRGGSLTAAAPDLELVTGLARVARLEREDFKFITLSFGQDEDQKSVVEKTTQIFKTVQDGTENSLRIAKGLIHIPRLVRAGYLTEHIQSQTGSVDVKEHQLGAEPARSLALQIGTLGQLDTFRFEDDSVSALAPGDHEVEFKTMASGINFRDLASAQGQIEESPLGFEASGIVTRVGSASKFVVGDRVFGLSLTGSVKSHVRSHEGFLAKLPDSMSWTEAASLPVAFTTAYMVFHETGSLRKGDKVLIHSAASELGQAAIEVAQLGEAELFVTVENNEKRDFIEATYGIPRDHIFSNQDLSYKIGIQLLTAQGVDLVLNLLSNETLGDTWDCVAPFGRLVELGSGSINSNSRIPAANIHRNIRFESFDLQFRALHDPKRTQESFQRMVNLILNNPEARTQRMSIQVYPFSQVQDAFRQIKSGDHIGKLVLEPHDDDLVSVVPSKKPTSQFDSAASYVIVGAFGGLGRSIARWMASRGVKNLILLSRRGPVHDSSKEVVTELESMGVKVAAPACDVTDGAALKNTVAECLTSLPPIKGCIQGSMVLKVS